MAVLLGVSRNTDSIVISDSTNEFENVVRGKERSALKDKLCHRKTMLLQIIWKI